MYGANCLAILIASVVVATATSIILVIDEAAEGWPRSVVVGLLIVSTMTATLMVVEIDGLIRFWM